MLAVNSLHYRVHRQLHSGRINLTMLKLKAAMPANAGKLGKHIGPNTGRQPGMLGKPSKLLSLREPQLGGRGLG